MITSARTVETLQEQGLRLPGRIAAVGQATAAALRQAGYQVAFVPTVASGAGIVQDFPPGTGRVLVPGSALSKPDLPQGLRALGYQVEVLALYTMEPVPALPPRLVSAWQAGDFGLVVVTAGSVARAVDRLLGWPAATRVLAVGQPTAAVLKELQVAASVSPSPTAEAVARAAVDLIREGNA